MKDELNQEEKKVLKWVKEKSSIGRDEIGFAEAMKALNITDAMHFNNILKKLKQHCDSDIIEEILVIESIKYYGPKVPTIEHKFTVRRPT